MIIIIAGTLQGVSEEGDAGTDRVAKRSPEDTPELAAMAAEAKRSRVRDDSILHMIRA